jgi:hypothetical protein
MLALFSFDLSIPFIQGILLIHGKEIGYVGLSIVRGTKISQ